MAYNNMPPTRNGHNMFEMASFMQKSIRRCKHIDAGYAASEMYQNYHTAMWNRLLVISSEDCFGILTKELISLREMDCKGYDKKKTPKEVPYLTNAIILLCGAKKSRDADYFACNFLLTPAKGDEIIVPDEVITEYRNVDKGCEIQKEEYEQLSLFGIKCKPETVVTDNEIWKYEAAGILQKAIATLDIENIGFAMNQLRVDNRDFLWKCFKKISHGCLDGYLDQEMDALQAADKIVNGKKKKDECDEIFICKAAMLLCYRVSKKFGDMTASDVIQADRLIDWGQFKFSDVYGYLLTGEIPDYVYDVHTIKGKKAGKTVWEMNCTEQAALTPLQPAFFDNGSYAPRYDYKYKHKLCTEAEYKASLEYRKGKVANPVEKIK